MTIPAPNIKHGIGRAKHGKYGEKMSNNRYEQILSQAQDSLEEYKQSFYDMSVGSLNAVMNHSKDILESLNNPNVKDNLTAAHLQGMIAVVEDQMRSIHDFVMYVAEGDDTSDGSSRPGLLENIRKKKEREGKKYRPARPKEKDRPDPEQWKKLTK